MWPINIGASMRYLIPVAIFLFIVAILGIGLTLDPRRVPSPLIGRTIPEFTLPTLREPDKQFSDQEMKNHVSLFNVWASWCTECRVEHPQLVALAKMGIVPIYGLNYKDKREDALKLLGALDDPYDVNAYDFKGLVAIDWGVYGVPETFLIDKKSVVRHKHIGAITQEVLNNKIIPLINKLKSEPATGPE